MFRLRIFIFILLVSINSFSQQVVQGNLKSSGIAVVGANVILFSKSKDSILGYTSSNNLGDFIVRYKSLEDTLRLEIKSLGYKNYILFLPNKDIQYLDLELKVSEIQLPEVLIKEEKFISKNNDTINYNVNSFAHKSDRVIIDVIKNLPGIKVTESGQILYQNKAINKFYVDGKDLLEDRYSIASNNLPVNAVEYIQLLENHQPIKMLDGIEQTERAAINIKLNDDAKLKLLGNGNVGIGLSPFLRDNNLSLLKFSKNIQYISSLKNNNVGVNLDKELNEHNFSQNLVQSSSLKRDLLGLVRTAVPPIDANRYWFNNNSLVSTNYLVGLNKFLNLKFNAVYEHDKIQNSDNATTNIFLPNDTIVIEENHIGERYYHKFLTGLILEANTKKKYLKDNLKFQRLWSVENDFISSSGINQILMNPFVNLINDLSGILNIEDNLLSINSFVSYTNLPQKLGVAPGQYNSILNGGQPYSELIQFAQLKEFFNNNSLSYGKKLGVFNVNTKVGVLLKMQDLCNKLELIDNENKFPATGNFDNIIERNTLKIYDETSIGFINRRISGKLGVNINFNTLSNNGGNLKQGTQDLFINPNLNFRYAISSCWDTNIGVSFDRNLSYLSNQSFILQNYRSLINNDIPLYRKNSRNLNYSLNYRNIINAVFANLGVSYSYDVSNVLVETEFNSVLITQSAILQDNPSANLSITADVNKYYLALKTSIDVRLNYSINNLKQVQRSVLTDFETRTIGFGIRVSSKINKAFSLTHGLELTRYKSSTVQMDVPTFFDPISFLKQHLSLDIFMPKDYSAKLIVEHYYNNANQTSPVNYYFADFKLQKTLKKPRLDFSVAVNNIFSVKSYSNYTYSNNYLLEANYFLRGRMLLCKVGFQF
ncbi:hypothetical protein [Pedobacter sp.]